MKKVICGTVCLFFMMSCLSASEAYCVTPEGGVMPAFSPDGKSIIYVNENSDGDKKLYRTSVSGKETSIEIDSEGSSPLLIANSGLIAFTTNTAMPYLMLLNCENNKISEFPLKKIVSGKLISYGNGIISFRAGLAQKQSQINFNIKSWKEEQNLQLPDNTLAVSPDMHTAAVRIKNSDGVSTIALVNIRDGRTVFKVPAPAPGGGTEPGGSHSPTFSPDGKYLAYVKAGIQPYANIYILNLKSYEITAFTKDDKDNQNPVFSPDGGLLAYSSVKNGKYCIWISEFAVKK